MIKFRLHRSTLQESMLTVMNVDDKADIVEYLNTFNCYPILSPAMIKCDYYAYDHRIGEDVYIITCSSGVLGFTNKDIE